MASSHKPSKNFQRIMKNLDFDFPGIPKKFPRSPDTYLNLESVDIYLAKKKRQLMSRIPIINTGIDKRTSDFGLHKEFLCILHEGGHLSVERELKSLVDEEKPLLENSKESGRTKSFLEDKLLCSELIKGLIKCNEVDKLDILSESINARKEVGERMITVGDFWLARTLFTRCFDYLDYIDDDTDRIRVELWCLIAYVCIYFEESQEIGFDLPTKCLSLAHTLSQGKGWTMRKSVMMVLVPRPTNVYGLKNDWFKIKTDWINSYLVATTLLHVLSVKKARYLQEVFSLNNCEPHVHVSSREKAVRARNKQYIFGNIEDCLTSALAYADEARQTSAFIATTLRRGLFFEEYGDKEKAMEDFFALYTLCKNFDEKEAFGIVLNRMGQHQSHNKKAVAALDYFVQELEIATEQDFSELAADALKDIGNVLLQEGHTWEAEECYSIAYPLFKEQKEPEERPNELDDITWAMLGISSGQHMWSRFSGLIRTQEKAGLRSVIEWKCSRKPLPIVQIPDRMRVIKKRDVLEKQYLSRRQSKRFFEFTEELYSRKSMWFTENGFDNIFEYINAPHSAGAAKVIHEDYLEQWDDVDDPSTVLTVTRIKRAKSYANSLKRSIMERPLSISRSLSGDPNDPHQEEVRKKLERFTIYIAEEETEIANKMTTFLENIQGAIKKQKQAQEESVVEEEEDDETEDPEV